MVHICMHPSMHTNHSIVMMSHRDIWTVVVGYLAVLTWQLFGEASAQDRMDIATLKALFKINSAF